MSSVTYDVQWREAMTDLLEQIEAETLPEDQPQLTDQDAVFQHYGTLYVRYVQIFKRLEECYDQHVHPQKRREIKAVLEATMGRLLEVKTLMTEFDYTPYINIDDILVDLKLTPDVLEVPVPHYFIDDRRTEVEEKEKLLDALIGRYGEPPPKKEEKEYFNDLTEDDAILIIQINERGRQGVLRAKQMREYRMQEERERRAMELGEFELDPDLAAAAIQRTFRGYVAYKQAQKMRNEELEFIGMTPPPKKPISEEPSHKLESVRHFRKLVQQQHEQEYQQGLVTVKRKLHEDEGPELRQQMKDDIRDFFIKQKEVTSKFPDFPAEEEGGSLKFFEKPPTPPPEDEEEEKGKKGKKGKKDDKKGKKDDKKGKKGGKKGKKGKDDDDSEDEGIVIPPSAFVEKNMKDGATAYVDIWQNRPEPGNFAQKHDVDLLKSVLIKDVEKEVRLQVDELLRVELANLKAQVEKEAGKKGKKGKKGKGKKKGKKGKGGKKGKKKKDPTEGQSMDSLFAELVMHHIVRKVPDLRISDFKGEYNLLGSIYRKTYIKPEPSLGQVRQAVVETCILPLGSDLVHQNAPCPRTCLLYGAKGTGKRMLAQVVAKAAGASFFDLTPSNIDGKYPGKQVSMMMHMVFKVAKSMAPSVIFIGDVDQVFQGKKKKGGGGDGGEPASRIKKDLVKEMKDVTKEHRVMIIGASNAPQKLSGAEQKALVGFFDKHLYIPYPEYPSLMKLWKHFIEQKEVDVEHSFDLGTLARISEGYTAGNIKDVVGKALHPRRIARLNENDKLTVDEFIAPLSKIEPVFAQDFEDMKSFQRLLPNQKPDEPKEEDEEDDKKKKGKKGKKGKKKK